MNVREKFEGEVCPGCDAYDDCLRSIEKQAMCATLSNHFMLKKLLSRVPGK